MKKEQKQELVALLISLMFVSICIIGYNLYMAPTQYKLVGVDLRGDLTKCENILAQNQENTEDLVNLEKTGADKNTFEIDSRCFKLMNDYPTMYESAVKRFWFGKVLGAVLCLGVTVFVWIAVIQETHRSNDDDEDKYF